MAAGAGSGMAFGFLRLCTEGPHVLGAALFHGPGLNPLPKRLPRQWICRVTPGGC